MQLALLNCIVRNEAYCIISVAKIVHFNQPAWLRYMYRPTKQVCLTRLLSEKYCVCIEKNNSSNYNHSAVTHQQKSSVKA